MSRFGSATDIFGEKLSLNLTDVNRKIIKKLAAHAAYDASRGTAITATNAVAFLLLTRFRSGATVEQLTAIAKILHREVEYKGVCFSFSGETDSVVVYGISVLGEHLVLREEKKVEAVATASASGAETTTTTTTSNPVTIQSTITYRPNLVLPVALELLYYANPLVNVFALESAVALAAIDAFQTDVVALKTLRQDQIIVERETILRGALYIAELLQVIFLATC